MLYRITYVKTTVALVDRDDRAEAEEAARAGRMLLESGLLKEWGEGVTSVVAEASYSEQQRFSRLSEER